MKAPHKQILDELNELKAENLTAFKRVNPSLDYSADLEQDMLQNTLDVIQQEKTTIPVIDIKTAIKRERNFGKIPLLKFVAGIAALGFLSLMGYKMVQQTSANSDVCEGQDKLACLLQMTSEQEIYDYLLKENTSVDDIYLYEMVVAEEPEYTNIELQ